MASGNEEAKIESGFNVVPADTKPKKDWILLSLRVVTFFATVSATLVMSLNKQTKNFVVATIGSTPITVPLTAKFQHTPAFVLVHNMIFIYF
jgi:hypothetical protein